MPSLIMVWVVMVTGHTFPDGTAVALQPHVKHQVVDYCIVGELE